MKTDNTGTRVPLKINKIFATPYIAVTCGDDIQAPHIDVILSEAYKLASLLLSHCDEKHQSAKHKFSS
jgi:hypothetical protein